jgi:energy-coupling factor transport system permease protein
MEEADKIMSAQKARGADFTNGSLIQRAMALIPILIPLFSSSIRHAIDLATAMECRCYKGGEGRTRMKQLKCRTSDILALLGVVLFGAVIVLMNVWAKTFLPF